MSCLILYPPKYWLPNTVIPSLNLTMNLVPEQAEKRSLNLFKNWTYVDWAAA